MKIDPASTFCVLTLQPLPGLEAEGRDSLFQRLVDTPQGAYISDPPLPSQVLFSQVENHWYASRRAFIRDAQNAGRISPAQIDQLMQRSIVLVREGDGAQRLVVGPTGVTGPSLRARYELRAQALRGEIAADAAQALLALPGMFPMPKTLQRDVAGEAA